MNRRILLLLAIFLFALLTPAIAQAPEKAVILYEHCDYTGQSWTFTGDVAHFTDHWGLNDIISSLRVTDGASVTLYEHFYDRTVMGTEGVSQVFASDIPCLVDTVIGNDRASSMRFNVPAAPAWDLYVVCFEASDGNATTRQCTLIGVGNVTAGHWRIEP